MKSLDFEKALRYPFNRPLGLLNIFWIFLPIFGWLALYGYGIRIVKYFLKGKFKELPIMFFTKDLEFGFHMFIKIIPFSIATVFVSILVGIAPFGFVANILLGWFVYPLLIVNFFRKETVESCFEFEILNKMMNDIKEYAIAILKGTAMGIIFSIMIIVLVGIPAGAFTEYIFLADWYRRNIK